MLDAHIRQLVERGSPRARFILEHGRSWTVDLNEPPRPKGLRRGRKKECYSNAGRLALDHPEWRYVEGYVALALGEGELVIDHAWLADGDRVIEPTLPGYGTEYFGVAVELDSLRQNITDHGCCCVFCYEALTSRKRRHTRMTAE